MTTVALVGAKGSPGVTTATLALAAVASSPQHAATSAPTVLVEADPAGGDVECWCGPLGEPGLVAVASAGKPAHIRLRDHAVELVPGVRGVTAPTALTPMLTTLRSGSGALRDAITAWPGSVFLDAGRYCPVGETLLQELLDASDVLMLVCRPSLAGIAHAQSLIERCPGWRGRLMALVAGGERPYGPDEVASALRIPVAGVLPWDQRGLSLLVERGVTKQWLRSSLATGASRCLSTLLHSPRANGQDRLGELAIIDSAHAGGATDATG